MRNDLPEHNFPPLSTRMIFLHHRARLHDHAGRQDAPAGETTGDAISRVALALLAALLLVGAVLLGLVHA